MNPTAFREKHDGALAGPLDVRLWLRLLSCTMVIEKRLKRRLTDRYDTTLPRFDVLAALARHPDGMTMGALSRSLLVSNGNVTGLIKTLQKEGHAALAPGAEDRRASIVRLTPEGREYFDALAQVHRGWISGMLGGLDTAQREALFELLGALKVSIAADSEDGTRT
ncbi:MAG: MarR family transcriptional regulator [Pseudomonadota bacterium]